MPSWRQTGYWWCPIGEEVQREVRGLLSNFDGSAGANPIELRTLQSESSGASIKTNKIINISRNPFVTI